MKPRATGAGYGDLVELARAALGESIEGWGEGAHERVESAGLRMAWFWFCGICLALLSEAAKARNGPGRAWPSPSLRRYCWFLLGRGITRFPSYKPSSL